MPLDSGFFDSEHEAFRSVVRQFVDREVAGHLDDWDERGIIDRGTWLSAGKHGLLGGATAMTEPSAGSDLQGIKTTARPDGTDWILNGSKTFITNGIHSDLVIVAARTGNGGGREPGPPPFGLFVVERGNAGFERGRKLRKIGLHRGVLGKFS
jgi:alkylation response protein AidB-like acyl-CoA dehydrogenase